MLISAPGDDVIQLLLDKRILLEDAQVLDEPIGSYGHWLSHDRYDNQSSRIALSNDSRCNNVE